jgi:hypothetical protein
VPTLPTPIQHTLGILSHNDKTGRRNKRNITRYERSETIPFCGLQDFMAKGPQKSPKKLDAINSFSKVSRHKINLKN